MQQRLFRLFLIVTVSNILLFGQNNLEWRPVEQPIMTKWAADVNPEKPLPEYPRPALQRESWINLNGLWDYAIVDKNQSDYNKIDGKILVPYPVESSLSGVKKSLAPDQKLVYKRTIDIPKKWTERILLNFEAVDWQAEVFVGGKKIGEHFGGYDPFNFDITGLVKAGENTELMVIVSDPSDKGHQPRGKQVLDPSGIWYTPNSGIWQTVWLESVSNNYIKEVKIDTDIDKKFVTFTPDFQTRSDKYNLIVHIKDPNGKTIYKSKYPAGREKYMFMIKDPILWSPESPNLYDVELVLKKGFRKLDVVKTYFGMRKISLGKDEKNITRIFLNNKEYFQIGPLDQGFWPDGIYTAPTDEALKWDIETTKEMGFNMLRKHVKVENRRFYYWCDKLGIAVWQDMPSCSGGIRPNEADMVVSKQHESQYKKELTQLVKTHYNHPSIIMWVPFNEGWGQFDTPNIVQFTSDLDGTRLVNNASGWTDRNCGDVIDMHNYPQPNSPQPEENRAAVLGEFGGLGHAVKGHMWKEENWGYRVINDRDDLINKYEDFFVKVFELKENPGLSAVVYTQTTDVETETNGLMTYDRKVIKMDPSRLRKIHDNDFAAAPQISPMTTLYYQELKVEINGKTGQSIYYTLDGSEPTTNSQKYVGAFTINESMTIKAIAVNDDRKISRIVEQEYVKTEQPTPIYGAQYHERYASCGDYALVDEKSGGDHYNDGNWQGFQGKNIDITIPLKKGTEISEVEVGFLEEVGAWIFPPEKIIIEVSADGNHYKEAGTRTINFNRDAVKPIIHKIKFNLNQKSVKFLRVKTAGSTNCPEWHDGNGQSSWIFVDEIQWK